MKSTVDQIRDRFDHEVERFSNLDTGQAAAMDARILLDLITEAALASTPNGRQVQDYIAMEDTPKSLEYQLDLLRRTGFARPTVLHKNGCFAAFGARKMERVE